MKKLLVGTLLLFISYTSSFSFNRLLIDHDWRFQLGDDSQWADPSYYDQGWRKLSLPHDWSIEGEFSQEAPAGNEGGYLPTGIGWYRRVLKSDECKTNKGTRTKLYFEGIYMNSTIYLNGERIGGHPYGYVGFWIDITDKLQPGDNTLAVRVDNSSQKNCRWYSGSGIYRHVWLCQMDDKAIDDPWKLYIRTGQIFGINAEGSQADSATILISYDGRDIETRTLHHINLWNPEHPSLYTIQVGNLQVEHGFRTLEYSAQGLTLNGQPIHLNGGCLHHDNGCIGTASYDAAEWRKARLMKEAGYNAVRTSHNPSSEAFIKACDHLGLMVIEEAFDGLRAKKTAHDYHELIDRWWQEDVDAMVLRDRNHPSIIAWSNGNEVYERRKIEIVMTTRKITRRMHQLDPSRPVTQALCEVDSIFDPQAEELDIVGYNYLIDHAEEDHRRCPERIIWQTESYPDSAFQSWEAVQRLPYVIGDFTWTSIDYLGESGIGRSYYPTDKADRYEHWQGSKFPWHGAYCGDIDLTGLRKPISYYRQTLWDTIPHIYIGVREPNMYVDSILTTKWSTWPTTQSWNWTGHEGRPIEVEVYSRFPQVRLYLNDQIVDTRPSTLTERYKATFTLPYQPGTLRAVGITADGTETESQTICTSGSACQIRLTADQSQLKADGQDLIFVTIEATDEQGNIVPTANQQLTIQVSGAGALVGVGNADMTDMDSYAAHRVQGLNKAQRHLWHGRAIAVIRSSHKAGQITLSVSGEGIKAAKMSLRCTR